jgi:hypothetical protein
VVSSRVQQGTMSEFFFFFFFLLQKIRIIFIIYAMNAFDNA